MKIKIWGSRGSMPVSAKDTVNYGGNTTCIEVETSSGDTLIFDAGTGISDLGVYLSNKKEIKRCFIFLTHYHWDHIQGLPFFHPIHDKNCHIDIYGPSSGENNGSLVKTALTQLFHPTHFPLQLEYFGDRIFYHDVKPGDRFEVGGAIVEACKTNHPGECVAYKITDTDWSCVFTGDHEHMENSLVCAELEEFIKGADLIIADGQYGEYDYSCHKGWGHSAMDVWPEVARKAGIKHVVITHHDPGALDSDIEDNANRMRGKFKDSGVDITFAKDGISFPNSREFLYDNDQLVSVWLSDFSKSLSGYTDVSVILDSILTEARRISNAEAGTVYLVEGDELLFSYTQNDLLFPGSLGNRFLYSNARLPINNKSIAGYTATYLTPLNIPDVYNIPPGATYSFNDAFDKAAGYKTVSVMAIPLVGHGGKLVGVVQLINSKNEKCESVAFTPQMEARLLLLGIVAANAVEKGIMAEELIFRMIKMSSLRDPKETASHVRRVGAIAAEIYQNWAEKRGHESSEIKRMKDNIRIAAMLHDVGKVGISDNILKKPGRLNPEERYLMQGHCAMGADLFSKTESGIDIMARDIALNHHQKWDGSGYTGSGRFPILSGEDIPLAARATAIADVFDALVSKRCYKDAWDKDMSLETIKSDAGKHFDPELVECFINIQDIVDAIYAKFVEDD